MLLEKAVRSQGFSWTGEISGRTGTRRYKRLSQKQDGACLGSRLDIIMGIRRR